MATVLQGTQHGTREQPQAGSMGYGEGQATGPRGEWAGSSLTAVRQAKGLRTQEQTLVADAARPAPSPSLWAVSGSSPQVRRCFRFIMGADLLTDYQGVPTVIIKIDHWKELQTDASRRRQLLKSLPQLVD